jgi:hypothetical protein
MTFFETLLISLGGSGVLLTALAFFGKSYLSLLVTKDIKQYESELKATTDSSIERLKNDLLRSVESYKMQLKKSEFMFARECDAENALVRIVTSRLPLPSRPGMALEEAYDEMIEVAEVIENELLSYRNSHGVALNGQERELLHAAISLANEGRFCDADGPDATGAREIAKNLWEALRDLENRLLERIQAQVVV